MWLRLLLSLSRRQSGLPAAAFRSLRFARCVPARLRGAFAEPYHEVPACGSRVFDPIAKRNTSSVAFDVHSHLSFAQLELRATRADFAGFSRRWRPPRVRDCADLRERLQRPSPAVLVLYGLHVREMLERCVEEVAVIEGESSSSCLGKVHLTSKPAQPLPSCEVGMHLRSMHLDDRNCDLLGASLAMSESHHHEAGKCRFEWRKRKCAGETFENVIAGCPGGEKRFVTADLPELYARTRSTGWADMGEVATVTWNERATTPYPSQLGDVRATAAAFVALARCRRAIVAPVPSQFSITAALAAGVPLFGCCTEAKRLLAQ
jgi:hypothetical protein